MKRALDVAISVPVLSTLSPLIAAAAIAVKLDSRGPVFYRGARVGAGGRGFQIVKLRSMSAEADRTGPAVTSAGDVRVTRVGRFLRRTKLDEVPQLWNVIRGDISLVGLRPEHPEFVRLYTPEQRRVLIYTAGNHEPRGARLPRRGAAAGRVWRTGRIRAVGHAPQARDGPPVRRPPHPRRRPADHRTDDRVRAVSVGPAITGGRPRRYP